MEKKEVDSRLIALVKVVSFDTLVFGAVHLQRLDIGIINVGLEIGERQKRTSREPYLEIPSNFFIKGVLNLQYDPINQHVSKKNTKVNQQTFISLSLDSSNSLASLAYNVTLTA